MKCTTCMLSTMTVLIFVLLMSQINRIFCLSSERIVLGQIFAEIFLLIFILLIPIKEIILNRQSLYKSRSLAASNHYHLTHLQQDGTTKKHWNKLEEP